MRVTLGTCAECLQDSQIETVTELCETCYNDIIGGAA